VYICDECVDVCVDILAHDHRTSHEGAKSALTESAAPAPWPTSDAWCAFCGGVADLATALLIENRTLLCESCVQAIAAVATQAPKGG
jgi:ATP-dependent protease Clp ATPase subunit